ncbi:dTDP-4-dehydrorhamnose reductase [Aureimonas populi]|uniref:dTDP-4-dehydrorhamnose reductase n=1 Tax=Aureimonas populi TaxID=1701758 RepID=A0ABW5CMK9_9HYPH|nr:dTDP-4-dehydrorhamnose reductase [Aureimonas populi]
MKLLVTGREGQIARSLLALSGGPVEIVAVGRPELDLLDHASLRRALEVHRPDLVVSAAAYTAVDKAESERDAAFAANADGAAALSSAAAALDMPIVHISTDYVFPGDKASSYSEEDATGPRTVYGASKLAGEAGVAAQNPAHAVLRVAWVYSPYGQNFLKTMLRLAADREEVRVVADQVGTPTYAPDIAKGILAVARHIAAGPEKGDWRGLFHLVAGGETNWAEFAREIFRCSAERGGPSARVVDIPTDAYPSPAPRPANSRLDTARFQRTFGLALPAWQDGTRRCVDELLR